MPIAAIGMITGGLILRRFRLSVRQNLYFMLIVSTVTAGMPLLYFLRCTPPNYAGMVIGYDGSERCVTCSPGSHMHRTGSLQSPCNENCTCGDYFKPVCNEQLNIAYYSPCYAGCTQSGDEPVSGKKGVSNWMQI
ncbi:unnamed protein product [Sphagnum balticum]